MIFGLGTDIIEISRIKRSINNGNFLKTVFSADEIETGKSLPNPSAYFAGRFSAKEALLKAAGEIFPGEFPWNTVCIVNDESGRPHFKFTGSAAMQTELSGVKSWHLSISHTDEYATAIVILEK